MRHLLSKLIEFLSKLDVEIQVDVKVKVAPRLVCHKLLTFFQMSIGTITHFNEANRGQKGPPFSYQVG